MLCSDMYLVTGAAGFIGFHTAQALLTRGETVIGIDNLNDYYDVALKEARLKQLITHPRFIFIRHTIERTEGLQEILAPNLASITHIMHLAAQAGVRHSLEAPFDYIATNIAGQMALLELCRQLPKLSHMVYASSSSVYGANTRLPFSPEDRTDHPISVYGATKKAAELMAESHARLYGIPVTGLRFFTAYGPWGRPDMAYFSFTRNILAGKPIRLFNQGRMQRDFTYIDDIVAGILAVLAHPATQKTPHRIYNLGCGKGETLGDFVAQLEKALTVKAVLDYAPIQPGDVQETCADISLSTRDFGYRPKTKLSEGLHHFVAWYRNFYHEP